MSDQDVMGCTKFVLNLRGSMKQFLGKRIRFGNRLKEPQEDHNWTQPVLADNLQTWQLTEAGERPVRRQSPFLRRLLIVIYLFSLIVFSIFAAAYYISFMLPPLLSTR